MQAKNEQKEKNRGKMNKRAKDMKNPNKKNPKCICNIVFAFVIATGKIYTWIHERVNQNVSNQCIDMKNEWNYKSGSKHICLLLSDFPIRNLEKC